MDAHTVFKDYLPPFATLIAAIAAASLTAFFASRQAKAAHLQAKIALEKLKFDTLGARLDILAAAQEIARIAALSGVSNVADQEQMSSCRDRIARARFYFRKDIVDYLDQVVEKSYDAARDNQSPTPVELLSFDDATRKAYEEERQEQKDARKFALRARRELPAMLESDISLEFLKYPERHEATSVDRQITFLNIILTLLSVITIALVSLAGLAN